MALTTSPTLRGELQRLVLAQLLVMLAVAGGLLGLLWSAQRNADSVYADRVVPLVQLKRVSDAYAITIVDSLHKAADGRLTAAEAEISIRDALQSAKRHWQDYLGTYLVAEEQRRIERIRPLMARADVVTAEAMLVLRQQDVTLIEAFRSEKLYPAFDPLTVELARLAEVQEHVTLAQLRAGQQRLTWALVGSATALLVGLLLSFLLARRIGSTILDGVDRAVHNAQVLANGDWSQDARHARHEPRELRTLHDSLHDVARQLESAMTQVASLAHEDVLTGLRNQRGLDETMDLAIARQRRSKEPLAVIGIDLDQFGQVNAIYGRSVGDEVLRIAARQLRGCLRDIDTLARTQGGVFIALLEGSTIEAALRVAERMRCSIAEPPPATLPRDLRITASLGVVDMQAGERQEQAFKRVARAIENAKAIGRNRVEVA